MRLLVPPALALLLSGCLLSRATVNEPLGRQDVAGLRPGQTTAAEVIATLGAPTEVVQLGRRSAYRFDATTTKRTGLWLLALFLVNEDTRSDRVWVFFDEDEALTHVGATFHAGDSVYALPWADIHED